MFWWRGSDDNNNNSSSGVFIIVGFAAALLAPLIATVIRLAISRQREYLADATGAMTTHYPEGLARALEKLQQYGTALQKPNTATAHMFIGNPLSGKSVMSLFSSHPPLENRIKILREMDTKV
jgi:heat shock protein HtpX